MDKKERKTNMKIMEFKEKYSDLIKKLTTVSHTTMLGVHLAIQLTGNY